MQFKNGFGCRCNLISVPLDWLIRKMYDYLGIGPAVKKQVLCKRWQSFNVRKIMSVTINFNSVQPNVWFLDSPNSLPYFSGYNKKMFCV